MPRMASPLLSSFMSNFTWSYIFIHHMICVLLGASFYILLFLLAVWIKYQDLKFLNVRESSHSYIIIQLLIDLHLYLLEYFVICSSASLISFRAQWWFYFEEIEGLSCFTYIIFRVLNSMVIWFGYEFTPNMMSIQYGYNKIFHIEWIEYYEKFDTW